MMHRSLKPSYYTWLRGCCAARSSGTGERAPSMPLPPSNQRVRVVCRLRPSTEKERIGGLGCTTEADNTINIAPSERVPQPRSWNFDSVHGPASTQAEIYEEVRLWIEAERDSGTPYGIFQESSSPRSKAYGVGPLASQ
eukprot:6181195-Pleurochrysis_carterae.AAC.4